MNESTWVPLLTSVVWIETGCVVVAEFNGKSSNSSMVATCIHSSFYGIPSHSMAFRIHLSLYLSPPLSPLPTPASTYTPLFTRGYTRRSLSSTIAASCSAGYRSRPGLPARSFHSELKIRRTAGAVGVEAGVEAGVKVSVEEGWGGRCGPRGQGNVAGGSGRVNERLRSKQ